MKVLWFICALFLLTACSGDSNDTNNEPPLQHYKDAIDSAKAVKQLEQNANQQRMPDESN